MTGGISVDQAMSGMGSMVQTIFNSPLGTTVLTVVIVGLVASVIIAMLNAKG